MARRQPPPGRLRIVSGEYRGRYIATLPDQSVRPLAERARTAMANALESRDLVDGAHVVDAFAGSGAAGLELLSRGAAHCTFVERDRQAFRQLQTNVESLLGDDAARCTRLLQADVLTLNDGATIPPWGGPPPLSGLPAAPPPAALIVVLDPPWQTMRDEAGRDAFVAAVNAMLQSIAPTQDDEPLVVFALVHDQVVAAPATLGGRPLDEDRAYGRTHVAWYGDM